MGTLVVSALGLARSYRAGKLSERESKALLALFWTSLLFEMRDTLDRAAKFVEAGWSAAVVRTPVRDALYQDFVQLCPSPPLITTLARFYRVVDTIGYWAEKSEVPGQDPRYGFVVAWAAHVFNDGWDEKYDRLLGELQNFVDQNKSAIAGSLGSLLDLPEKYTRSSELKRRLQELQSQSKEESSEKSPRQPN